MEDVLASILHDHYYFTNDVVVIREVTIDDRELTDDQKMIILIEHDHEYANHSVNKENTIEKKNIEESLQFGLRSIATAFYTARLNWRHTGVETETDYHEICEGIVESREIVIGEEIMYHQEHFLRDNPMFQSNIPNVLGSSVLDRKMKLVYGTSETNQFTLNKDESIEVSRPTLQINTGKMKNNTGLNLTINYDSIIIHTENGMMEQPYNTDIFTNLTRIQTGNPKDQSMLYAENTIHSSNIPILFENAIKQEKDCDDDQDTTTGSLSMLEDLISEVHVKIEESVSEWNDKMTDSVYILGKNIINRIKPEPCLFQEDCAIFTEHLNCERCRYCIEQFGTSEMRVKHECICQFAPQPVVNIVKLKMFLKKENKGVNETNVAFCKYCNEGFKTIKLQLKHECICKCSRRLVVELRHEIEVIQSKKRCLNSLTRELEFCWKGIEEVWNHGWKKTKSEGKPVRVQKKKDNGAKWFACTYCTFKTKRGTSFARHIVKHNKDGRSVNICYHCGYKFSYKSSLKFHLLRYKEKKK